MRRLALGDGIYLQICQLAQEYEGEFSVMLFGKVTGDEHLVLYIAPPGKNAKSEQAFCTSDSEHESEFFSRLLEQDPAIEWLGDLHAHPPGIPWLSHTDRRTIRRILLGTSDAVHPKQYVAGVMLRTSTDLDIFPVYFTREDLDGSPMEIRHEGIHKEPTGTRHFIHQTYRRCRYWVARQRPRRHGSASGCGDDHADRP